MSDFQWPFDEYTDSAYGTSDADRAAIENLCQAVRAITIIEPEDHIMGLQPDITTTDVVDLDDWR